MEEKTIQALPKSEKSLDVMRVVRDLPPAHYKLKIDSFSLLTEILSKAGDEKYVSGEFEAGGYKWKLSLFPNGDEKRNGSNHISLYLVLAEPNSLPLDNEIIACFKFFVYDQIRDMYLIVQDVNMEMRRFYAMKSEWGFPRLIPLSTFKDAANGYLVDDCCIFGAEVFVRKCNGRGERFSVIKEPQDSILTLTIDKFSKIAEEFVTSKVYTIGEYRWKWRVYPKGDSTGKGSSVSFFLCLEDNHALRPGQIVYATYKLRIKDQVHGTNHFERKVDYARFSATDKKLGFSQFIPLTDLNKQLKGYILNDSLIVEGRIVLLSVVKSLA